MRTPVSLVTACMNRHAHLCEVLPTWLGKGFAEIVILDWSSNPPLSEIVAKYQDGTIVLAELANPRDYFSQAKSKNLRLRLARHSLVCTLDSDVKILVSDFLLRHPMERGVFYAHGDTSLGGSGIFWKSDWQRFNGCNETMTGWGYEDWDLFLRMSQGGLQWRPLVLQTVQHIPHDDQLRVRHLPPEYRLLGASLRRNQKLARASPDWVQERIQVVVYRPGQQPREGLV